MCEECLQLNSGLFPFVLPSVRPDAPSQFPFSTQTQPSHRAVTYLVMTRPILLNTGNHQFLVHIINTTPISLITTIGHQSS